MHPLEWLAIGLMACAGPDSASQAVPSRPVEFNRDIRPLLANNCFSCHGADSQQRKGELRLDRPEGLQGGQPHRPILVPGKPLESELYRRISHAEPSQRMPP